MRVITVVSLSILIAFCGSSSVAAGQCEKDAASKRKVLDKQIETLQRATPKELSGKQVNSGECVLRGLKLGIIMGLKKDYQNQVQAANAIACLEIEKFMLTETCTCQGKGWEIADDPVAMKSLMGEKWKSIKTAEARLRKAGIKNPAIQRYVANASAARDCISQMAVQELDEALAGLNSIQEDEPESEIEAYKKSLRKLANRSDSERAKEAARLRSGDLTREEREANDLLLSQRREFVAESQRLAREAAAARENNRRVNAREITNFVGKLLEFGALAAQGWNAGQQIGSIINGQGGAPSSSSGICPTIRANLNSCRQRWQSLGGGSNGQAGAFKDCVATYSNASAAAGC